MTNLKNSLLVAGLSLFVLLFVTPNLGLAQASESTRNSESTRHLQSPQSQPDIVIIMVDEMGWSEIGGYGGEIPTPNLDALASHGVRFPQFYHTGRCCPTRASLLTGMHSHQAGIGSMTNDQGLSGYRGRLSNEIDRGVGTLVNALREKQELDNTLMLFLSDNGGNAESGVRGRHEGDSPGDPNSNVFIGQCWAHLNDTPFRKYKHYNHEGGIASPLIAHWPDQIPSRPDHWIQTPSHVIDLMATCVDVAQATYPDQRKGVGVTPMRGQSLLPLMTQRENFAERALYWEHEGNAAIHVGDQKLVREGRRGDWQLFNLNDDHTEQNPVDDPERKELLLKQWQQWAKSSNVLPKPETGKPKAKKKWGPNRSPNQPT